MDKKIDWSKAPEGATHYCLGSSDGSNWRDYSQAVGKYWDGGKWKPHPFTSAKCLECAGDHVARPAAPAWSGEGLPPVEPTIKTLEQRIIDRAEQRLKESVEAAMLKLRLVVGVEVSNMDSGINGWSVSEAIDAVGDAIFRMKAPSAASAALDSALEELADRLEPSALPHAQPMPPRER